MSHTAGDSDNRPVVIVTQSSSVGFGGAGMMLLAAAIFAYFGFAFSWAHQLTTDTPPKLLIMVVLLKWTLRVSAIGLLLAAVLVPKRPVEGNMLAGLLGMLSSVVLLVVAIWDFQSPYMSGISPILLVIFALWNGFSSVSELAEVFRVRAAIRSARYPQPSDSTDLR